MTTRVNVSEEIYPHEYLWSMAKLMIELTESNKRSRRVYLVLSSLLHGYMAFEAFINFCGFILFPKIWENEKDYFKGIQHGIDSKISKLSEKLSDFVWEKGRRPYQNIKKLHDLRDSVAHGKVVASKYEAVAKQNGSHIEWKFNWYDFMDIERANVFLEDIKAFCQSLLLEMRKHSDHRHLIYDAFEGPLGHAEGSGKRQIDS